MPEDPLEKLERDLDAQGVTDPDYREFARVMLGKALKEAEATPCPGKELERYFSPTAP